MNISICSLATVSAYGSQDSKIWNNYCSAKPLFSRNDKQQFISQLHDEDKQKISQLAASNKNYKKLDKTVLYGIYVARKSLALSQWNSNKIGINMSSSRGATELFEKYHSSFIQNNKISTLTSPSTTLGNISSWLAHDLNINSITIEHSITCSSAFAAIANACAWLQADMCSQFIVGASEAPLTDFTIAQMQTLGIYAKTQDNDFPCRALDLNKTNNSMILAEAAGVACLEKGNKNHALAAITGIGYGTESLTHNTSLSINAKCLQRAMLMAIGKKGLTEIDIIITHTPGTIVGDNAEITAINTLFNNKPPALTCNKWQVGHALATSGMLSLQMALFMLNKQKFIATPLYKSQNTPKTINNILINSVGFGGNAVSLLISKNKY